MSVREGKPRTERPIESDVLHLPVVVEQEIGSIVLDPNGTRSILGGGLNVVAGFVNDMAKTRATPALPMNFSFENGKGGRFRIAVTEDDA